MLFATVLLAAQASTDRHAKPSDNRGTMPAPCNTNTLLNEFTDCHIECGVHQQGEAIGSRCATNFCGSDGICCRKGVSAGVCDGNVGCDSWHCCVCTTSSTHSPTGAPAVHVAGDPFTSYNGKKSQFYVPNAVLTPLIQCGNVAVLGRGVSSNVKNDDQQWFDKYQVNVDGTEVVTVEARRTQQQGGSAEASEGVDAEVADKDNVGAALQTLRLAMIKASSTAPVVRSLTTLNVTIGDKLTNVTGSHTINGAQITIGQLVAKSIGTGFSEFLNFDSADLGLKIMSSVAGKFANDEDRIHNLHVDIKFTDIDTTKCSGALPEIWGVKPMTKETAKLLVPPKAN